MALGAVITDQELSLRFSLPATLVALTLLHQTPALPAPVADSHQHLFSPAAAALVSGKKDSPGITASDVVALLDKAGIQRALVLSMAYTWGKASREPVENEYEHVRAENDWTAQQVAQYPTRLRAFCSVNPLKPYALEELARCSKNPLLRSGLKLHFGNSDVDLDNPDNVALVKQVFAAANGYRMAIVVHMHASIDNKRKYGADEARVFLNEMLPAAPDVPVQIAHLAGAGGYGDAVDAALGVLVDAIGKRDSRVRNLWFDASVVVRPGMTAEELRKIAARIRQIGVERVLYGSDAAASPATYPETGWAAFQRLPLTAAEFRVMTSNVAPYLRDLVAGDVFQSPVFVSAPGNVIAAHELFRRLDLDVTIDNARRETVPSCPPGC
jgi:predicted TIM-barrel fold metal-dependent hydrolase